MEEQASGGPKDVLKNAEEFLESANDNLGKHRFNASVADFFKAIVIFCDYLIYRDTRIRPKNHNDRFSLLKKYFSDIYSKVSELFDIYTKSYTLRLSQQDCEILQKYAYELKNFILDKK